MNEFPIPEETETETEKARDVIIEQPHVLTREEVLAAQDIATEMVYVPEWNGWIKIRGLTVGEVNTIVRLSTRKDKMDTLTSALFTFVRACVEPKFTDADLDELKKKSALVLRIVKDINRLSGMSEDAADEAKNA